MKVVFFGSPDFAVASLEALLASHHEVVGVVTQPDRPAGRGLKMEPPAVKVLALKHNLPILQPEKVNCEDTYRFLDELDPDILTVIAYGAAVSTAMHRLLARSHPLRFAAVKPLLSKELGHAFDPALFGCDRCTAACPRNRPLA